MNLIINSKFRPFTYDEMVKPLAQYKEAYDKVEQDYTNLTLETEALKNMIDRNRDKEVYDSYSNYANELSSIVDDFSKGMNMNNRSALLGMKRRYASTIVPIANAITRRKELADEQRKASLSNPTMLYQRQANDMSLSDFINNPSADYGNSYSGNTLTAQVAAGAAALAKQYRDNPDKLKSLGDYYEYVESRGYTVDSIMAAMKDMIANNDPKAPQELKQLVYDAVNSSGIDDSWSGNAYNRALQYASQGLWQAAGQDESQLVQDWRKQADKQHADAMARQKESQRFQAEEAEKNRKFQTEQMTRIPMLDENGNPSNRYYDPKLGVIVDSKGRVIPNQAGGFKPPTETSKDRNNTEFTQEETGKKILNSHGITPFDLSKKKIRSISDVENMGFQLISIVAEMGNGFQWQGPNSNDIDLGSDNTRLYTENGIPVLKDPSDPSQGFMTTPGKSRGLWGWTTSSNVVGNYGDFIKDKTDNGAVMRYLTATEVSSLPVADQAAIFQSALEKGYKQGDKFEVFAVRGGGGKKNSYIIFKPL